MLPNNYIDDKPKNLPIDMSQANADALRSQATLIQQNSHLQPRRTVTLQDLQEKAELLQAAIQQGEWRLQRLRTEPGRLTADEVALEITKTQKVLDERKQTLSRIKAVMLSISQNGVNGGGPGGLTIPVNVGQPQPPLAPLVPLDLPQFQKAYWEEWFPTHVHKDKSLLTFDGRTIDLYQLHCEVIHAGSQSSVNQKNLWPAIGAKLGFLDSPGAESESSRSGPAFAAYLENIYNDFLAEFDHKHIHRQAIDHLRQQYLQAQSAAASGAAGDGSTQDLANIMDPTMTQGPVAYTRLPASELHNRGVPPHIIAFIEYLRGWDTQRTFQPGPIPAPASESASSMSAAQDPHSPFADNESITVPDDKSAEYATVSGPPSPTTRISLLSSQKSDPAYGTISPPQPSSRKLLCSATLKMATIFFLSTIIVGGTLWVVLPTSVRSS